MGQAKKLAQAIFPTSFSDYWFEQQAIFARFSTTKKLLAELTEVINDYNGRAANQAADKQISPITQKVLDDTQALKEMSKQLKFFYHPDRHNLPKEQAESQFNRINQIFKVLIQEGKITIEKNLKINSKALRITSSAIQSLIEKSLYLVPLTLVIFYRKDYTFRRLCWVSFGISLSSVLVLAIIATALMSFIKQPDFSKDYPIQEEIGDAESFTAAEFNEIKYNLLLNKTKGMAQPHVKLITEIAVTCIFCATLVVLGKNNILESTASYKAAAFAGSLFMIGLILISIYQNLMVNLSEAIRKDLDTIENDITNDFLERKGDPEDLTDLHAKYSVGLTEAKRMSLSSSSSPEPKITVAQYVKTNIIILAIHTKESSIINTMVATAKVSTLFKEPKPEPLQPSLSLA